METEKTVASIYRAVDNTCHLGTLTGKGEGHMSYNSKTNHMDCRGARKDTVGISTVPSCTVGPEVHLVTITVGSCAESTLVDYPNYRAVAAKSLSGIHTLSDFIRAFPRCESRSSVE